MPEDVKKEHTEEQTFDDAFSEAVDDNSSNDNGIDNKENMNVVVDDDINRKDETQITGDNVDSDTDGTKETKDDDNKDNKQDKNNDKDVSGSGTFSIEDLLKQIQDNQTTVVEKDKQRQDIKTGEDELSLSDIQDEDVKEHLETFLEFYPEYKETVLTLASGDDDISKRFINKLKSGDADIEDVLAFAIRFEIDRIKNEVKTIYEEDARLKNFLQKKYEEFIKKQMEEHVNTIVSKHPEMEEILSDENETKEFKKKVLAWASNKPYKEYKEIERVINGGTAQEVVKLLDMYKQENMLSNNKSSVSEEDINKSMAVKGSGKTVYVPTGAPPKDDFDATWDAITKQ